MSRIRRRSFLRTVGAAAGAALVGGEVLKSGSARAASGSIYSAHSPSMVSGSAPSGVQETWVKAGMDACVLAMTGKATVGEAYAALFPGVTPAKKIAIKINCLKPEVSPQFATIKALVQGLTSMCGGAFPAQNIYLFDNTMSFSGLSKNRMATIYGTAGIAGLGIVYADPSPEYSGPTFSVRGSPKYPATYLAAADYGIDLSPLKRHQYYAGGITGVIKNMMGACSASTGSFSGADATFHDGPPYQSFVDLFKNYMSAKLQLYVVDMLFAAATENDSGWSNVVRRITLGSDPCAVDSYVADVLNSLGISGTKAVPQALAGAGLGTTQYTLVEPAVSLEPREQRRTAIDAKIRDRRAGKASDADVRLLIKEYRK